MSFAVVASLYSRTPSLILSKAFLIAATVTETRSDLEEHHT